MALISPITILSIEMALITWNNSLINENTSYTVGKAKLWRIWFKKG